MDCDFLLGQVPLASQSSVLNFFCWYKLSSILVCYLLFCFFGCSECRQEPYTATLTLLVPVIVVKHWLLAVKGCHLGCMLWGPIILFALSKLSLNDISYPVQPWFTEGSHHRIFFFF